MMNAARCQKHQWETFIGICLLEQCHEPRLYCRICVQSDAHNHPGEEKFLSAQDISQFIDQRIHLVQQQQETIIELKQQLSLTANQQTLIWQQMDRLINQFIMQLKSNLSQLMKMEGIILDPKEHHQINSYQFQNSINQNFPLNTNFLNLFSKVLAIQDKGTLLRTLSQINNLNFQQYNEGYLRRIRRMRFDDYIIQTQGKVSFMDISKFNSFLFMVFNNQYLAVFDIKERNNRIIHKFAIQFDVLDWSMDEQRMQHYLSINKGRIMKFSYPENIILKQIVDQSITKMILSYEKLIIQTEDRFIYFLRTEDLIIMRKFSCLSDQLHKFGQMAYNDLYQLICIPFQTGFYSINEQNDEIIQEERKMFSTSYEKVNLQWGGDSEKMFLYQLKTKLIHVYQLNTEKLEIKFVLQFGLQYPLLQLRSTLGDNFLLVSNQYNTIMAIQYQPNIEQLREIAFNQFNDKDPQYLFIGKDLEFMILAGQLSINMKFEP